jgi:hypothetical protein
MYKLRLELPNLLRTLAHLDERESTTAVFNRCMQEAHNLNSEVAEFSALYAECSDILQKAREQEGSDAVNAIGSAAAPQPLQQPPNSSTPNPNPALATQQSIQNLMQSGAGGTQDQPITFDNDPSMNFIQL